MPLSGQSSRATVQAADWAAFDSQIWAQTAHEFEPLTYVVLDPDGNGVACDGLSPGATPVLWTDQAPAGAVPAKLARVTDGDTIRVVVNGREEPDRLILIDTPETHDPNDPAECFGQDATAFTTWLFSLGGQLYLEPDQWSSDGKRCRPLRGAC